MIKMKNLNICFKTLLVATLSLFMLSCDDDTADDDPILESESTGDSTFRYLGINWRNFRYGIGKHAISAKYQRTG